jgi:integrase
MRITMLYVMKTESRGRAFYYYRRVGRLWGRLRGTPGSVEFAADYERAAAKFDSRQAGADRCRPGSFGALAAAYRGSAEYSNLGPRTRQEYARHLGAMIERWCDLPVALMERRHVLAYRDKFIDRPSVGNNRVKVLRRLLSFSVDRGWRSDNPALRIGKMREGEWAPWTEHDVARFRAGCQDVAMLVALDLAIYTGQRQGDIIRMLWSHFDGEGIHVVQSKTGARLWIPCHANLKARLGTVPRSAAVILTTVTGRSFTSSHFKRCFRRAMAVAGIEDRVFHGLRKTATAMLAEAGCSDREIMSVTGHRTHSMVSLYASGARQKRLATAAIARLGNKSAKRPHP